MKKKYALLLIFLGVFSSFKVPQGNKVTVAVAANMQYAIKALKEQFEKQGGVTVEVIIGSSGKLTQQIQQGAPFDIFISADTKYPAELYKTGFAADTPKIYAKGLLVLCSARPGIKPDAKLSVLSAGNIKKIAIANPKTAPYGVAAVQLLKYYHLYDKLESKLVYGESITQTDQFILSQSADIGFTAKSIVTADEAKGKTLWVDLDQKAYSPIDQAAVVLKHGMESNKDASDLFYAFLYSAPSKKILKKFGYIVK